MFSSITSNPIRILRKFVPQQQRRVVHLSVTSAKTVASNGSRNPRRRYNYSTINHISNNITTDNKLYSNGVPVRAFSGFFENESEFHTVADETLEDIQDTIEYALEEYFAASNDDKDDEFEIVYAEGVLTMSFPPHGTWVLNKQTPNQQIWWSSPISGPRRYEYDEEQSAWMYTRANETINDTGNSKNNKSSDDPNMTLSSTLRNELKEMYGIELDLK